MHRDGIKHSPAVLSNIHKITREIIIVTHRIVSKHLIICLMLHDFSATPISFVFHSNECNTHKFIKREYIIK